MCHPDPIGYAVHPAARRVVIWTRRTTNGSRILPQIPTTFIGTSSILTANIPMSGRTAKFNTVRTTFEPRAEIMSAITETEPGGEMVCIQSFSARPRSADDAPIPGPRREFQVGEHVRFLASYFKNTPRDNPTGYMAVFEPLDRRDKNRYAATQDYFVSLECWEGLKKYFASMLVVTMGEGRIAKRPEAVTYKLVEANRSTPQIAPKSPRGGASVRKSL
jgi:hypothetical protein